MASSQLSSSITCLCPHESVSPLSLPSFIDEKLSAFLLKAHCCTGAINPSLFFSVTLFLAINLLCPFIFSVYYLLPTFSQHRNMANIFHLEKQMNKQTKAKPLLPCSWDNTVLPELDSLQRSLSSLSPRFYLPLLSRSTVMASATQHSEILSQRSPITLKLSFLRPHLIWLFPPCG